MTTIDSIRKRENVVIEAFVILPDHFHLVVDIMNSNISKIMQKIKMRFGALYRGQMNLKAGRIWQHRFWDHIIRNQDDLNRHIDYIHYNPVKHGLAKKPQDWEYSSFNEYLKKGHYSIEWGTNDNIEISGEFGE